MSRWTTSARAWMMVLPLMVLLALASLVGCARRARVQPATVMVQAPAPSPPPEVRYEPAPAPVESPAPAAPATAVPDEDACSLIYRAERVPAGPDELRFVVRLENRASTPVEVELPDRCPGGPIEFEGPLPTYDVYGVCASGPCLGPRTPRRIVLQPGERREVASASLPLDGDQCRPPLRGGSYALVPRPPERAANVVSCGVGIAFVGEATTPPPSPPPPSPPPPSRPPATPPPSSDPYACTGPGQCVLSCPSAPGCCGWPCGCSHAIHRDHAARFEAEYPRTCERAPCPAMGCAYEPAVAAECVRGRCVASDRPTF